MDKTSHKNQLYFGDNLDILRQHIPDESIDLIYLDPPFNSNATYNVLYKEHTGERSAAQIAAFEDTWHWGEESERTYWDVVSQGPPKVAKFLSALRECLGNTDMMAYITMMAIRLVELHRVLKPTGSLYLHCDPTASHYLKIVLDSVFGGENYRNEISWRRSAAHNDTKQGSKKYGNVRDAILFYSKAKDWQWNAQYIAYSDNYVDSTYRFREEGTGRRYRKDNLTAAKVGGDTRYEWRIKRPVDGEWEADISDEYIHPREGYEYKGVLPYGKRIWAYSKANMLKYAAIGRIVYSASGMPNYKRYLDEMPGVALQNDWNDIPPAAGNESLGYPTQKPEALLERIIKASSNEGDILLDPFCGCGTAIGTAERLQRRWIGIDITHLAITLIKHRLHDTYGDALAPYEIAGAVPKDRASAAALAQHDRYQFEWWALGLVDARPGQDKKKGADRGIDGYIYFRDDLSSKAKKILVQVKSGHVTARDIRDLRGVVEREHAAIGVFITLEEPTKPMEHEATTAGFYVPEHFAHQRYPRVQICTIADLLHGKGVQYPHQAPDLTFTRAPRRAKAGADPQAVLL